MGRRQKSKIRRSMGEHFSGLKNMHLCYIIIMFMENPNGVHFLYISLEKHSKDKNDIDHDIDRDPQKTSLLTLNLACYGGSSIASASLSFILQRLDEMLFTYFRCSSTLLWLRCFIFFCLLKLHIQFHFQFYVFSDISA